VAEAPAHAQPAQGAEAQHGESAEHAESPWGLIARIFNFVVLVGALVYFLRAPLAGYLSSRSDQIRNELVTAKNTTATATAQLAEIDAKLKALPAEIETLKKRGAEEIVAEEARIKKTAEAERHRLLEQTRREIELQVRLAKRDLTDYAATLAVDLATDRIKQTVTDADQQRLIDRYVTQVRSAHE
jgi:ATP synthase F0 subunit b